MRAAKQKNGWVRLTFPQAKEEVRVHVSGDDHVLWVELPPEAITKAQAVLNGPKPN